ncbi:spore germination protein [Saliterribacillus persicus]|uniref:Stage V sporulation protein AF n=1 Tax=Saliterribacillus persicus TaxID=930114 RepID=A0A368XBN1_9BACI|nr:spore germination protein [Saliterribacillus persicus]RCW65372.1 stage V sporulation protein AF [Saliterribacillus persicus]
MTTKNYDEKIAFIREYLNVEDNFDMIHLDLEYGQKRMSLFLIDGLVKDEILQRLMEFLARLEPETIENHTVAKLLKRYIPYVELDVENDTRKACEQILAGPTALVIEGYEEIILIDARTYPVRSIEEPDLERVVRGSREGYVETIIFNTALTRRKIRDRSLKMEYLSLGRRSKTDLCICYIEDIADQRKVTELKSHLKEIDTDGLPMAEKTIEEFLGGQYWNPYPTVRYTERPDTAAAHLYEGHIIVIIDGSPSVMITPTTYWHHLQHAEEYRQKPVVGSYLRFVRFVSVFLSLFILPLYFLLSISPSNIPEALNFIGPSEVGTIPLFIQFLIAELGVDMLRMAAIHTPSSLTTALGLVSAILIGQIAVEVGLFSNEVILYISVAVIGTFATPSYELGLANRLFRILLLIITGIFGVKGFIILITVWIIYLASLNSFRIPYLWPILPFSFPSSLEVIFRTPVPLKERRPAFLNTKDSRK